MYCAFSAWAAACRRLYPEGSLLQLCTGTIDLKANGSEIDGFGASGAFHMAGNLMNFPEPQRPKYLIFCSHKQKEQDYQLSAILSATAVRGDQQPTGLHLRSNRRRVYGTGQAMKMRYG